MPLITLILGGMAAAAAPDPACIYDRDQVLSLTMKEFDQGANGWRRFEQNPRCFVAGADMIRDYRNAHHSSSVLLFWHEGQLRGFAGQTAQAIALFKNSYQKRDDFGWGFYVDGTIAFLRHDRKGLQAARDKLAVLPRPADLTDANGKPVNIEWPPNLPVLDELLACFHGTYYQAYGDKCPSYRKGRA